MSKVIAVASGKGGTGKTSVAVSLALAAGSCTYLDLDVEEPNGHLFLHPHIEEQEEFTVPVPRIDDQVCTYCGKCARSCVYNALAVISSKSLKKAAVFPELCHSCGVCSYVCPVPGAIQEEARGIGHIRVGRAANGMIRFIEGRLNIGQPSGVPLISGIVEEYLETGHEGLAIIDAAPGTSCPVVESLRKSDFVVLVTEPTPFGLNDLKLAAEVVQYLGKKAGMIINKVQEFSTDAIVREVLHSIERYSAEAGIPVLLHIPYAIEIQQAYSKGIPLAKSLPVMEKGFLDVLQKIRD